MIKLFAALELGPLAIRVFGFDMIISEDSIYFSMEKGTSLNDWIMSTLNAQVL